MKDGFEYDLLQHAQRNMPGEIQGQIFVPPDLIVGVNQRSPLLGRDLNVTNAVQGGNFVASNIATPIIELLRNKLVTERAGAQLLAGLQGNVAIPRQAGAATAYSLAEQAVLTKSTQEINQAVLVPHRVGAFNSYSKQLLLQSSVDIENFVRDDLMKVLAIKLDHLVLAGNGGAEPVGIRNSNGIGSVTFGGAATWEKVIEFETALSLANADAGRMAYVGSPSVRAKWKQIPKVVASTFPIFLWEPPLQFPDAEGAVNGYRAFSTNQITDSTVAFANWEDVILALWGGFDVVIDPYTSAASATVNITVNAFVDVACRHAASFAWSTDSGAQ